MLQSNGGGMFNQIFICQMNQLVRVLKVCVRTLLKDRAILQLFMSGIFIFFPQEKQSWTALSKMGSFVVLIAKHLDKTNVCFVCNGTTKNKKAL